MLRNSHSSKLNYDVFITAEFPEDLHYRQASSPVVQPIVLLVRGLEGRPYIRHGLRGEGKWVKDFVKTVLRP